jgi:P4 family phage/plasmid primase-like protien
MVNEGLDVWGRKSYMLEDLAKSGLMPSDFPFGVEDLGLNDDGQARYKINITPDYWKIKIDRKENKYVGPKGVVPPVASFGNFHNARIVATVEGYKKALLFHITTGIPTFCLDGCWAFGEFISENEDVRAKDLHTDILVRLTPGQDHIVVFDGDWATNDQVRLAQATYRMLLEEQGAKTRFKDLGVVNEKRLGYDDWFVATYGGDRDKWPDRDTLLMVLVRDVPAVPAEELLGGNQAFMLTSIDRFSTEYLDLNDRGAASLLIKLLGAENFKYIVDDNRWVQWNGRRWEMLGDAPFQLVNYVAQYHLKRAAAYDAAARRLAEDKDRGPQMKRRAAEHKAFGGGHCSSTTGRGLILRDIAKSRPEVHAWSHEFDAQPWLLGVANGVVDLRTGKLRAEEQSDMILRHCPIEYSEEEPDSLAEGHCVRTFLQEIMGRGHGVLDQELHDYFQRRMGAALFGANMLQSFEIWTGVAANGKSALANIIQGALGKTKHGGYSCATNPNVIMGTMKQRDAESSTPFLVLLKGARMVFAAETKDTQVFNDALIKQVTGGEEIQARGNYQEGGSFTVAFNFFLLTNHIPNCTGLDTAMLDRLVVIPFDVRWKRPDKIDIDPSEKDLPLGDAWWALEAHAHPTVLRYMLWWLVSGAVKWRAEGLGPAPERVASQLRKYVENNDRLGAWLAECNWVFDPVGETLSGDLYRSYRNYTQETGGFPVNNMAFSHRLLAQYPMHLSKVVKGGGKNYIRGIRASK